MRLDMNINSFYAADGVTTFIDRMLAFLNMNDTSRLKIVGVRSGSVIIDTQVIADTSNNANQSQQAASLNSIVDQIKTGVSQGTIGLQQAGLGAVLSTTFTVNVVNTDGTQYSAPSSSSSSFDNKITIIIAVVVSVLGSLLIGVTIFLVVKKLRVRQRIRPDDSDARSELG
jgi:hypothetical protein